MSETSISISPSSMVTGIALPAAIGIATVSVADTSGRLVLRADPVNATRIGAAVGVALDMGLNRAVTSETTTAVRLGPDEWMFLADAERDPWLTARIAQAAGGAAISLVDVSHRSVSLILAGPAAEAVLAAGCALPLDVASFPPGKATRTLLAKAEIVLWRHAPQRFHLEVAASFTGYVLAFLGEAIGAEAAIATIHAG